MRVLVEDASPGLGGALTSLAALTDVLGQRGHQVRVLASSKAAAATCGLDARALDDGEGTFATRVGRRVVSLLREAHRFKPDVILANNAPAPNLAAAIVARALDIPRVQYVRGAFHHGHLARSVLADAAAIFVVGREVHIKLPQATRVSEGLSRAQWPSPRTSSTSRRFWCSALTPWKGISLLQRALHEAPGAGADVCAADLLAWGSPDAIDAPWAPGCEVHRNASQDVIDQLRARCGVYVHTALQPEPFGRSVLESMAAGLCPVVPDEGGPSELVLHQVSGLHYQARSHESLVQALKQLDASPALREHLAAEALARAPAFESTAVFEPVVRSLEASAARLRSHSC